MFFGTRCKKQRSSVGFIDFDIIKFQQIRVCEEPVLSAGALGYFDDNGVYPGCIVRNKKKHLLMYYLGRSNGVEPLFYMSIGLAESRDGGLTFNKALKSPLLSRSEHDPWMVSTPWVVKDSNEWKMWYLSGIGWKGKASYYHIKYAFSSDGIHWKREGKVCIDFKENETNIASPTVIKKNDKYFMWFSYSSIKEKYKIGYAESNDGLSWVRKEEKIIFSQQSDDWDSKMMAYPSTFFHKGKQYLLYSGNENGKGGIGLAVLEN